VLVFVQGAAKVVVSADVELGDVYRVGDWWGQWVQRSGVGDALTRPMAVVESFELSERMWQVALIPK
jgi:hypothetical protein